jgi:hypothetical protein
MKDRYAISTSGMVHDRANDTLSFIVANRGRCGTTVSDDWDTIDARSPKELAIMFRPLKYCSNCFNGAHRIKAMDRKCHNEVEEVCSWD